MSNEMHQSSKQKIIFAEGFKAFLDDLECLYIKGNQSGRIKFLEQYPEPARYIFGNELIAFDSIGGANPAIKSRFEEAASKRRDSVLIALDEIEAKSVVNGVLQIEYVRNKILELNEIIAPYVFNSDIIAKLVPALIKTPIIPKAPDAAQAATPERKSLPESTEPEVQPNDPIDKSEEISLLSDKNKQESADLEVSKSESPHTADLSRVVRQKGFGDK